jgi:ABC-type lipoprotein release transport system permease subunit
VQIEKNVMFIILLLIVAVAAFNIVSTLVMAVTDKQADIAILRTLGREPGSIMAVFIVQGALIGVIGLALGVAGGVALALNIDVVVPAIERLFNVQFCVEGGVLHLRAAVRPAVGRCLASSPLSSFVLTAGDAVSELARLARQSGGGAAL